MRAAVAGIGPAHVSEALDVPPSWTLIGYLCLGFPQLETDRPELEAEAWERRRPWETVLIRR